MKQAVYKIAAVLGIFCLFVFITFAVWLYFRGTQPLELPEARGITFWQFIRERWSSWRRVNTSVSAQPQFAGCRNNILSLFTVNFHSAANFVYASLVPASRLAQAFLYWQEQRPDAVLPALQPIQWFQAPDAFWNYFSAAYWRALVSQGELAGSCNLGPVDFSSVLGEGA